MPRPLIEIALPPRSHCPICNTQLCAASTMIWRGIAVCADCYDTANSSQIDSILTARANDALGYSCWSDRRGVQFFTPPAHFPRTMSYRLAVHCQRNRATRHEVSHEA